ncbi:MAG: hypothetical protein ACRDTG_19280 [Pseudonocardiaceae bacterium]
MLTRIFLSWCHDKALKEVLLRDLLPASGPEFDLAAVGSGAVAGVLLVEPGQFVIVS